MYRWLVQGKVSQYGVRQVRTPVLGSSNLAASARKSVREDGVCLFPMGNKLVAYREYSPGITVDIEY